MSKKPSSEEIKKTVAVMPESPGVYLYYNNAAEIIYVGKANNLKKRVASYFSRETFENNKLRVLVSKIFRIEYIVVGSESDALLLENNLVKKHQPRYNVLLKDDKTYPWICIKNEPFPRVFYTRNMVNDGSKYFGPYTSVYMVKVLLDLIKQLYPIRTCNLNLVDENIKKKKFKPCLEFHIGNCKAPCIGLQTSQNYQMDVEHINLILKGNIIELIQYLSNLMKEYSAEFKYEEAQKIKDKIEILEKYKSKSSVVSASLNNVDVFSIIDDSSTAELFRHILLN